MKLTLAILALASLSSSVFADNIAIFKRTITVTVTNYSEQPLVNPAVGNAKLTYSVTSGSYDSEFSNAYEIINLTTGERIVVDYDVKTKTYQVGAQESTIGYRTMKLKAPGSVLWYNAKGETSEFTADFEDAAAVDAFNLNDYFSTKHATYVETGKAAPVVLNPTITITVPKTITILGDAAIQNLDIGAPNKTNTAIVGDKGVDNVIYKGTSVFDQANSLKASATGLALTGTPAGSLDYGVKLVKTLLPLYNAIPSSIP